MICREHREFWAEVAKTQRTEKARRSALNREPLMYRPELKALNDKIRSRRFRIYETTFRNSDSCGVCGMKNLYVKWYSIRELFSLASSTVERPFRNREVVGSNPALGSSVRQ